MITIPESTESCEVHVHPTPHGGVYSCAYYSNKWHEPCTKDEACYIYIGEYDANGHCINGVHGFCGEDELRTFTQEEIDYFQKIKAIYDEICLGKGLRASCIRHGIKCLTEQEFQDLLYKGQRAFLI